MKNIIQLNALLLLVAIIISCDSKQKQKTTDKPQPLSTFTNQELIFQKEKIYLLSVANKISYDTAYQIIKDYYIKDYDSLMFLDLADSSITKYKEVIQSISRKYQIPKSKIASILFSFKYEMRSPEEIIEEYKDQEIGDHENEDSEQQ